MRLLKTLIKNNVEVWIYCENKELQEQFLKQAENEGFLALNGQKPSELHSQQLYGINDNMTIGYLSLMCWSMAFKPGDMHVKVDYGKYISGKEVFFCNSPHFEKVEQSEWKKIP